MSLIIYVYHSYRLVMVWYHMTPKDQLLATAKAYFLLIPKVHCGLALAPYHHYAGSRLFQ